MAAGCMPSRMFNQSTSCEYSRVLQSTGRGTANGKGVPSGARNLKMRSTNEFNSDSVQLFSYAVQATSDRFHIVRCKLAFPEVCWNM